MTDIHDSLPSGLPSGLPQSNWLPASRDVIPQLSADSQDSFVSQVPLPYHLAGYRDEDDTLEPPSTSAETDYKVASYVQPSEMPFNSAPANGINGTNGASGSVNHNPYGTEYQNMAQQIPVPYPDYLPHGPISQNYQTAQFYEGGFSGQPIHFQNSAFPPQMNHNQMSQYNQQDQVPPAMYHYPPMQQKPQYPEVSALSSANTTRNRSSAFQVYDPRGMQQVMPYTSTLSPGENPSSRKEHGPSRSDLHRLQKKDSKSSSVHSRNGHYEGRSSQHQNGEQYGYHQGNQDGQKVLLTGFTSQDCRQRDSFCEPSAFIINQSHQQEYAIPQIGVIGNNQQQVGQFQDHGVKNHAPYQSFTGQEGYTAPLTLSEVPTDFEVKTPPRQTKGSAVKYSTPATAPPLGQKTVTPILRSRAGQSIQKIKIDPILGPPPAFEPKKPLPRAQAAHELNAAAATFRDNRQHSNSMTIAIPSEDPFTSVPFSFSPDKKGAALNGTPTPSEALVLKNPFGAAVPRQGPIAPLVLPSMSGFGPSPHLAQIALNGTKPTLEIAFDPQNLPFVETARFATVRDTGVVRICNIPFNLTTAEVVAFLGRNARILKESDEPIHIIMERISGKTMDAFVEFTNIKEAVNAVDRYKNNKRNGRGGKLGNRFVDLQVSGQEQLMAAMFPNAKNVVWHGAVPQVLPTSGADANNTGFKGFITNEELAMFVKHIENPQRCPFSKDCPQRPFEFLVSTIVTYPWFKVGDITLEDRDQLFGATRKSILALFMKLNSPSDSSESLHLNDRLMNRILRAVFWCPGFTQGQKDDIAFMCGLDTVATGLAPYADHWHVFKALGPHPSTEADVLTYYIALIREATTSPDQVSLAEMSHQAPSTIPSAFGNMCIEYPPNVQDMSLAEIANIEWLALDKLLRKALLE